MNYCEIADHLGIKVTVNGDETIYENIIWIDPEPSQGQLDAGELALAKVAGIAVMAVAYVTATNADVTYDSVVYQSGEITRKNLAEAVANYVASANALPSPFTWRAKDNSDTTFNIADINALAALVGTQKTTAIFNLQAKKDAINAAADVAAVNAINW